MRSPRYPRRAETRTASSPERSYCLRRTTPRRIWTRATQRRRLSAARTRKHRSHRALQRPGRARV